MHLWEHERAPAIQNAYKTPILQPKGRDRGSDQPNPQGPPLFLSFFLEGGLQGVGWVFLLLFLGRHIRTSIRSASVGFCLSYRSSWIFSLRSVFSRSFEYRIVFRFFSFAFVYRLIIFTFVIVISLLGRNYSYSYRMVFFLFLKEEKEPKRRTIGLDIGGYIRN